VRVGDDDAGEEHNGVSVAGRRTKALLATGRFVPLRPAQRRFRRGSTRSQLFSIRMANVSCAPTLDS
jgi:hypothetical protein